MTIIKQVAVTTPAHVGNVGRYLDDERALMRDSQHIAREGEWRKEMEATRRAYGHDAPARGGSTTYMYHQVIGFNADECSCNGGKMTPERCMAFAREWVRTRYPNQEAVWVLHKEHCAADGTDRFAVHIAVNRTDLETGLRLNEGRSRQAKVDRANAMREMDRRWGLAQVETGRRNSKTHAMQPTRAEREMGRRGERSDKQYMREAVRASVAEAKASGRPDRMRAFSEALERKGVRVEPLKSGRGLTYERVKTGRRCGGHRLGAGYSAAGIAGALGIDVARAAGCAAERGIDDGMGR